jgi:hypothetical protein
MRGEGELRKNLFYKNINQLKMQEKIKVLGIPGSLRKDSYNLALLNASIELKPENMEITVFTLHDMKMLRRQVNLNP